MDGSSHQLQQYKDKIDEMKQEKMSLVMTYENNVRKYQEHINSLERENMLLLNDLKKMESQVKFQVNNSKDKEKCELLQERLKIMEAENSSLVLENEAQRHQYDSCLDDIANQVVTALLGQKKLKEECSKLKERVQDLEIQNDQLSCLFHHQMRISSDSLLQLQCRSGVQSPVKVDNHTVFVKSTDSIKSMCSDYQAYDDPNLRSHEQVTSRGASSSPPISSTPESTRHNTSLQRSSLNEQYRTKIETEFPASKDSTPKIKHISVLEMTSEPIGESDDDNLSTKCDLCQPTSNASSNLSSRCSHLKTSCNLSVLPPEIASQDVSKISEKLHPLSIKRDTLITGQSADITSHEKPAKDNHLSLNDVTPKKLSPQKAVSRVGVSRCNSMNSHRLDGVQSPGWQWINGKKSLSHASSSNIDFSDDDSDSAAPGYATSTFSLNDLLDNSVDSTQETYFEDEINIQKTCTSTSKDIQSNIVTSCFSSTTTSANNNSGKIHFYTSTPTVTSCDNLDRQQSNLPSEDTPMLNSSYRPRSLRLGCRTLTMMKNKPNDRNTTPCDNVDGTCVDVEHVVSETTIDFPVLDASAKPAVPTKRASLVVENTVKTSTKSEIFRNNTFPGNQKLEISQIISEDSSSAATGEMILLHDDETRKVANSSVSEAGNINMLTSNSPYTTMFYNKYRISREKSVEEVTGDTAVNQKSVDDKVPVSEVCGALPSMMSSDSSCESIRAERSGSKDDGYSTMSSDVHPEILEKLSDSSCGSGNRHFSGKSESSDTEISPASYQNSPQEKKKFESNSFIGKLISPLFQRKFGAQNSQKKTPSAKSSSAKVSQIPSFSQKKSSGAAGKSASMKASPLIQEQESKCVNSQDTRMINKHKNKALIEINSRKLDVLKESSDFSDSKMENSSNESDDSRSKRAINDEGKIHDSEMTNKILSCSKQAKEPQGITSVKNSKSAHMKPEILPQTSSGANADSKCKLQRSNIKTVSPKSPQELSPPVRLSSNTSDNTTSTKPSTVLDETKKVDYQNLQPQSVTTNVANSIPCGQNDSKINAVLNIYIPSYTKNKCNDDNDTKDGLLDTRADGQKSKSCVTSPSFLKQPTNVKSKVQRGNLLQDSKAKLNQVNNAANDVRNLPTCSKIPSKSGTRTFTPPVTPKSATDSQSVQKKFDFSQKVPPTYRAEQTAALNTAFKQVNESTAVTGMKDSPLDKTDISSMQGKASPKFAEPKIYKSPSLKKFSYNLPKEIKRAEICDSKIMNKNSRSVELSKTPNTSRDAVLSVSYEAPSERRKLATNIPAGKVVTCVPLSPLNKILPEMKVKPPDFKAVPPDLKTKSCEVKSKNLESTVKSGDYKPTGKLKSPEVIKSPDIKSQSFHGKVKSADVKIQSPETKMNSNEVKIKTPPAVPPRSISRQQSFTKNGYPPYLAGKTQFDKPQTNPNVELKKETTKSKLPICADWKNTSRQNSKKHSPPVIAPKPQRFSNPISPDSPISPQLTSSPDSLVSPESMSKLFTPSSMKTCTSANSENPIYSYQQPIADQSSQSPNPVPPAPSKKITTQVLQHHGGQSSDHEKMCFQKVNFCQRKIPQSSHSRSTLINRSYSDPVLYQRAAMFCSSQRITFRRCVSFSHLIKKASASCDFLGRVQRTVMRQYWMVNRKHDSNDAYSYSSESESEAEVKRRSRPCRRPNSIYRTQGISLPKGMSNDENRRLSCHERLCYSSSVAKDHVVAAGKAGTRPSDMCYISQIQDSSFEDECSSGVENPFNEEFYSLCRVESNRSLYSDTGSVGGSLADIVSTGDGRRTSVENRVDDVRTERVVGCDSDGRNLNSLGNLNHTKNSGGSRSRDVKLRETAHLYDVCNKNSDATLTPNAAFRHKDGGSSRIPTCKGLVQNKDTHSGHITGLGGDNVQCGTRQSFKPQKQSVFLKTSSMNAEHNNTSGCSTDRSGYHNERIRQTQNSGVPAKFASTNIPQPRSITHSYDFNDGVNSDDITHISKIDDLHASLSSLNSACSGNVSNESLNRLDDICQSKSLSKRASGDDFHWENDEEMIYISPYSTEILCNDGSTILEDVDAYDWPPDSPYNSSDVDYHSQLHDFSEQSDVFDELMSRSMLHHRDALLAGSEVV